jgi:hypothetical protein
VFLEDADGDENTIWGGVSVTIDRDIGCPISGGIDVAIRGGIISLRLLKMLHRDTDTR